MSQFNIDAPDFVPGLNIHATSFTPSFTEKVEVNQENVKADEAPKSNWEEEEVDEIELPTKNDPTIPITKDDRDDLDGSENQVTTQDSDETLKYEPDDLEKGKEIKKPTKKEDLEKKVASQMKSEKEPVNVVFVGHVDAGKSTIGGHILYLTGMVDKRTLEKYEKEAKEKNRESWYLSWALDTNQEERDKGKTQEYGRADFETEHKHFTLLDAPGHKNYVPSMIGGAAQADLAILVISARKGEFETGFERGGQTREHAELVKTFGVKRLIVLINKMDDPTVNWSHERYKECCDKLTPFLRSVGFRQKTDLFFMPCSGLTGAWLKDPPPNSGTLCPWYTGPPLLTYLDNLPPISRSIEGPFRLPVSEKLKDMGMFVIGKIESGYVCRGSSLVLMPNKVNVEVMQLLRDEEEVESCYAGQNVKVKLKNIEEDDVTQGFVLCHPDSLIRVGSVFDAEIYVKEAKNIMCAGFKATMHIHCCVEWVELKAIICLKDKKTGEKTKINPRFVKQDQVAIGRFQVVNGNICIDTYSPYSQMGRFTLREGSTTVAYGKVLKVLETSNLTATTNAAGINVTNDQQAAIVPPVGGT